MSNGYESNENEKGRNLRGEMSTSSMKLQCPTLNLNWILNASKDDTNEVLIDFLLLLLL